MATNTAYISSEESQIRRALSRRETFVWDVLEADQGAHFYQRVCFNGTVRQPRSD